MFKYLLLLLPLSALAVEPIQIKEIHCFSEAESANLAFQYFTHDYMHRQFVMRKMRRAIPPMDIELVHDGKDQFGRTHCLLTRTREFHESERSRIRTYQQEEDQRLVRKDVQSIKDPWGGEPIELNGNPRVIRSCKANDAADCLDLIITARKGEDNVIEFRFWLGAKAGEGLAVYKSAGNDLELSKVMNQLKKDKENLKYTFAPKGSAGNFVEDARLQTN